jgi:integrase
MASLIKCGPGKWRIGFSDKDGKPQAFRLEGEHNKKGATTFLTWAERLIGAHIRNLSPDPETVKWLAGLGDTMIERLTRVGLTEARPKRESLTLGEAMARFIAALSDGRKPRTMANCKDMVDRLTEFLGKDRPLERITEAHGREWLADLRTRYAEATISRTLKRAKQFFTFAVRAKWITANPFADFKAGSQENASRKHFIDRATVDKVMDACPSLEWKAIVALARYGGLRIPSELQELTWRDVDWDPRSGRLLVRSPKTEAHEGKGSRYVPLFPELRQALDPMFFDPRSDGATYIIAKHRGENLRTQFLRILKKAGVEPWEKPFVNLRASCATELVKEYPAHVAAAWLGHSPVVAAKHYLQVREEDFIRAVQGGAGVARQPARPNAEPAGKAQNAKRLTPEFPGHSEPCDARLTVQYPRQDSNLRPTV